jgi:uncharacterized Fe-S radical SAM superfamily protein PflX
MMANATPTEIPNEAGLGFVLVELDLAATFCELALSTRNEENKERNARNARKAYNSAIHYLQRISPDGTEQTLINKKFSRFSDLLERLASIPDKRCQLNRASADKGSDKSRY